MASLRQATRFLRGNNLFLQASSRGIHAKSAGTGYSKLRPLLIGGAALGGTYGVYQAVKNGLLTKTEDILSFNKVHAAGQYPESQPSVFSQTKDHALYLTIHLKPTVDAKACAKAVSALQAYVDVVCPKDLRDEDDEIWAGVGFGPNFYSQVAGKTLKNYTYPHRKGSLGDMPSTGGDIFIHAKSNSSSKLFELCQKIMSSLPADSVRSFEDIYSFVFRNGRDLSGFIDGTENPADDEHRQTVAVEKQTGGSYVITQKWIHKMKTIGSERDSNMEKWVGRTRQDSTELSRKTASSHVARMTGGANFNQKKRFEMVRQSMPFGTLSDKCGLFFIGYAESPENLEFMLDRMVGAGGDPHCDDIMRLTECITGTYWYFPGVAELKKLA